MLRTPANLLRSSRRGRPQLMRAGLVPRRRPAHSALDFALRGSDTTAMGFAFSRPQPHPNVTIARFDAPFTALISMGRTGGRCYLLKETSPALHTRRCRPEIERQRHDGEHSRQTRSSAD